MYNNMNNVGIAKSEPKAIDNNTINYQLDVLNENLKQTFQLVNLLEERVCGVLMPPNPDAEDNMGYANANYSYVYSYLDDRIKDVSSINSRINEMIDRVQL